MNQHLNEKYSPSSIDAIWQKAIIVSGLDPAVYRKDKAGAWIRRDAYGNYESGLGWEIDHIKPEASGGKTVFENLQPLNWNNNRSKSNTYPGPWKVAVISSGNENIWAPENTTCL